MDKAKTYIKADDGKLKHVVEFSTGAKVEIPINSDGTVRWYGDRLKSSPK